MTSEILPLRTEKIFIPLRKYFRPSSVISSESNLKESVNIEDLELARLCARGDDKARKEMYTRYAGSLYAICIRYVGDRELARDLMHDSMIRIYDTIGKYRPTGTLKSWMSRVTVNLVIDHIRKARKFQIVSLEGEQEKIPEPSAEEVRTIPKDQLMRMVSELPETKRVIFNLFCVEGYSHKDISQMLGIKEKTSSSLLFKAREQLAGKVKDYLSSNV